MTVRGDRRVVCSACTVVNSETRQEACLIGPRHWDRTMVAQFYRLPGNNGPTVADRIWHEPDEYCQGFIDQWGVYMSREEAWIVATAAGQIIYTGPGFEGPRLFSENLY